MKSNYDKYTIKSGLKTKIILAVIILLTSIFSNTFAQTTGDYRSNGNVNFTSANNWQKYNGSAWVNATTVPPLNSGVTTINNYTVIDASINIAGTLIINATVNSSNNPAINVSGVLNLNSGGIYLNGNMNVLSGGTFTDNAQFSLVSGSMNVAGNFNVTASGQFYGYGSINLQSNGTITNNNVFQSANYLAINGTLSTGGTNFYNSGTIVVNNGGQIIYNQNGNTGNIPIATWNTGSTLQITGITNTIPQNLNQSFYNLIWNCSSQSDDFNLYDVLKTVNGNLSFLSTNNHDLKLFNWSSNTITVGGDLNIAGNTKVILGGGGSSNVLLNVNGNYTQSGGSLDIGTSVNTMNLKGNFTSTGGKVMKSGGTSKINFNGTETQYFSSSNPSEISNGVSIEVARNSTLVLSSDMKVLGNNANNQFIVYGTLDMNDNNIYVNYSMNVNNTGTLKTGTGAVITPDASANVFSVDNGGTLYIGSVNGITTTSQQGNIQVKGTRTYNAGAKYVYSGVENQVAGDGLPSNISGNLTMQNVGVLTFGSNQTVSGSLNMVSGLINMGTNTLILSNASISSLTYTEGLISGKFQRAIANGTTGQYIFPMGQSENVSRVLTFNITSASSTAGTLTAEFIPSDAGGFTAPLNDNGYTVDSYSKDGYWKLTPSGLTGTTYSLLLEAKYISGVQNPTTLRIIVRTNSVWSMQGVHSAGTGSISDPVAKRNNLKQFGDYVIAGNSSENPLNGSLPVEMKSFTANASNNSVTLMWKTSSEINNQGFDVERSDNGINSWNKVGFVKGSGTTNQEKDYKFTDSKLQSGKYKYRLKQVDYNGNFEYYTLQNEINITVPGKFVLSQNYPNPFNPATKIEFQISSQENVSLVVSDITGRTITTLVNKNLEAGYYKIDFDGSKLSSGIYFYTLKAGNNVSVKKMVLMK